MMMKLPILSCAEKLES